MNYEFEDIITEAQVSEDFAYDSDENVETDLTFEQIDTPIKELKVIILSIDWEITSEVLDKYQQEIKNLEELWSEDNIALAFLRILGALGIYIKKCQASAHPAAVKLLYSVYNSLEMSIVSKEMTDKAKIALIEEELHKYNAIRDTIKQANTQADEAPPAQSTSVDQRKDETAIAEDHTDDLVASAFETTQENVSESSIEEITPALADVPISNETSLQTSSQDTDRDVAGRLNDFFGEDDATTTDKGISDGVVTLSPQKEENASDTPIESDDPIDSSENIDLTLESDDEEKAPPEDIEHPDAESSSPQEANIFDDLFSHKQTTPADDLLLKMHMPNDAKNAGAAHKNETNKTEEVESDEITIINDEQGDVADSKEHNKEVSQRLDTFFGEDELTNVSDNQTESNDGVVPMPDAQEDSQSSVTVSEIPVTKIEETNQNTIQLPRDDNFSSQDEIGQKLDTFFGDDGDDGVELSFSNPEIDDVVPLPETQHDSQSLDTVSDISVTNIDETDESTEQLPGDTNFSSQDEIGQKLDSFFGDDGDDGEELPLSNPEIEGSDGVIPLTLSSDSDIHLLDSDPESPAQESTETIPDNSDLDSVLKKLNEIIAGIDTAINSDVHSEFSAFINEASELLADNTIALMCIDGLRSQFTTLHITDTITDETKANLQNLCEIISKSIQTSSLSDTKLTAAACEEIRKHISFQDKIISKLTADK